MKLYTYFILVIIGCVSLQSCDKYLDVQPKGYTLLTSISDYDQWLNSPSLVYGISTLNYLGDNFDFVAIKTPPTLVEEFIYTWAAQYSSDLNVAPAFWSFHYANINLFNTVLVGIDKATGGTDAQRQSIKAEALLGRAYEYFYLINEYAKEYDSSTVSVDLGVPFVTSNDVSQTVPGRSKVNEIYQQIISDINAAIPYLPSDNSGNRYRGSKSAAYSVLARIYFYAGNYAEAQKNAMLALDNSKATMIDFNGTIPSTSVIATQQDVIYGRFIIGNSTPTLELLHSFAPNDLRLSKLYYSTDNYTFAIRGATYFIPTYVTPGLTNVNTGTSVQEMKLIVSESAARLGDLSTALKQLDELQRNRFTTSSYVPYNSSNKDSVLNTVLEERNHELPFSSLRWFDMRRLDKKNEMETVYRYDAQSKVIATLPPHSNKYTLQIPLQVLKYNPGMEQNQ